MTDEDPGRPLPHIDASTPNVARVWNYLTGGRDNFDADRKAARQLIRVAPAMEYAGYAARAFTERAVCYLTGEAGIRQFIDISAGMPAPGSVHEVARALAPRSRVLCVDSDPVVLSHARALLRPGPEGATSYLHADLRETGKIIAAARGLLDLGEPVAALIHHELNHVGRDAEVRSILDAITGALCPGSHLALVQAASDIDPAFVDAARRWNKSATPRVVLRARPEITAWLDDLDIIDPGVVPITEWRPAPSGTPYPMPIPYYAALARKPGS